MADDVNVEEHLANPMKIMEGVYKHIQHQDVKITKLGKDKGETSHVNYEMMLWRCPQDDKWTQK